MKWLWLSLLLAAGIPAAEAYPPRFWGDLPGGGDVCLYENLTAGHSEEFPAVVDTELGRPEYGYLGCRRSALDWPAGPNRVRLAVRNAAGTSAWTEAILPRPQGAVSSARLSRDVGQPPPPPEPVVAITRFGGGNATFNPSASQAIAWPDSVTADYAAVLVLSYFNGTHSGPQARNTPTGFTLRGSVVIDTYLTYSSIVDVFTRDLDGTETGNITVSFAGQVYGHAALTVLSGDGDLTFASISAADTGNGNDATAPSVSGAVGQGLVVAFGTSDPPGTTNSGPSGFTLGDEASADTNGVRTYFKTLASAGATGTATWDFTTNREWAGFSILFNDAGAAAPAITLQSDGSLLHKPSPAGGDKLLFLTTAGAVVAKTAAGSGDRLITLSGGNWLAN